MAGEKATFEWVLYTPNGRPRDLTDDTVDLYVSKGVDRVSHLKKTSAPGEHYDAVNGTIRFTFNPSGSLDVPFSRDPQTWWYEIWIVVDGMPHTVGELNISPSIRV